MQLHHRKLGVSLFGAWLAAGCAAGPGPQTTETEPSHLPTVNPETGYTSIVSGAADSVGWQYGSQDAQFRFRFRQTQPGSDRFSFRDRELTFYFRPTTDALHFQVENLKDRPVWIDWERSTFLDPDGNTDRVAHSTTRWEERFSAQAPTQIPGLQRFGDYMLPMRYLLDPAGGTEQLHRRLFPEDETAMHYVDAEFGVDLAFLVEDQPRTYTFRFKVASVIPR